MRQRLRGTAILASALIALLFGSGITANAADSKPVKKPTGPEIRSTSALVVDAHNGDVIFERKAALVTPIASITKLMTALVVLDGQQPLDEVIKITADDRWKGKGAFTHIPVGAKLTRADLLRLALMASENLAARTLARHYPGGIPAFVRTMNVKARALGMTKTHFDDPSGLSSLNVSNARDLVKLVNAASRDPAIREFSTLRSHEVVLGRTRFEYRNTNLLVGKADWSILVQKTGFTNDAGQCLVMEATIDERPVVMVFLNSFGSLTRTADARRIRRWMEAQGAPSVASAGSTAAK
jgi:D-alanyl-D-alanine endopeptidase (penicillin-binding protein 7)